MRLEAVHEERRAVKREGALSCADILGQVKRGFLSCECPQFLVQKSLDLSKFMVVQYGQGGLSQCGHFIRTRWKG